MTTCVEGEFKHWHVDEMLLSQDKQVIVLELIGCSFPGKNLMVMLTDHGFCLYGLSTIMFVVKLCKDPHEIDKDYAQQCSSEVKL